MVEGALWAPSRLGNTLGGLDVFRRWLIEVLCRDDGWLLLSTLNWPRSARPLRMPFVIACLMKRVGKDAKALGIDTS